MADRRYEVIRNYQKCLRVSQEFYDPQDDTLALISPTVVNELGGNGSFEFEIPRSHKYFGDISPLVDEFMVRDTFTDETIFVGRPISYEETDFKTARVFCEGSLAYLHDILHRPQVWDNILLSDYFSALITAYNNRKREVFGSDFQQIGIGNCVIDDRGVYRTAEWEEIYELLQKGCLDSDGGYLIMNYDANGSSILNWYKELPEQAWQPAHIGSNLVRVNEKVDLSNAATAFIPKGSKIKDAEGKETEERYMIPGIVTSGQDNDISFWQQNGYVEKLLNYDDEETVHPNMLLIRMRRDSEFLLALPWENSSLECTVADLHFLDGTIPKFKIGQQINTDISRFRTNAAAYLTNAKTYITKITTKLDSAVPDIVIGTLKRQALSDQYKKPLTDPFADTEDLENRIENLEDDFYGDGSGGSAELVKDIYIYMGSFDYEDGELEEPDPIEDGYTKIADHTGAQVFQRPMGDILNAVNYTDSTTWTVYEVGSSKVAELQGSTQQVNVSASQSGGGVLQSIDRRVEFKVPVTVNNQQEEVSLTLEIPASESIHDKEESVTKITRTELSDKRDCVVTFELVYTKNSSDQQNYLSAMRLVSTMVGHDTSTMNYLIRFKMPTGGTNNEMMELTIDISSSDMTRDSAGTHLKKARKYHNGNACIINFRLTYTMNKEEGKAYVTSMTLASAYYARTNVTDNTTWSVWHD